MADVICPYCNERFHETTDKYNPDLSPNGSMFRLKHKYRDNGWEGFPEHEGTIGENLCCPECTGPYPEGPQGRVRVDADQYAAETIKLAGPETMTEIAAEMEPVIEAMMDREAPPKKPGRPKSK